MYVQILGTAIVDAIRPQLETDKRLAGPASLDAFWVPEPNLMPIGGPYQIQVINGMDYAIRELDASHKKICALTKDDPYGQAGLAGLMYAASKDNFTITSQATFKEGDTDFTAQINQLQNAGCEITVLVSLPQETAPILTAAAGRNFNTKWLGQSQTLVTAFTSSALAPYLEANFVLMAEGPQWGDTTVPGMKQMLDDIAAYAPDQPPDIYFAFGYSQAWAAAQILTQAVTDGDLSPAGILDASTKVSQLTFGGLLGDYKYGPAAERNPPRASTMFAVDPSAPGGLKSLQTNFTSQAAQDYQFKT
jgi:ABC-type branched-subunit amino acid transport system substrate-binding protein